MSSPLRRHQPSVIQQLLDAPQRFEWCQALRLLLGWLHEHGVAPDDALAEIVRFDNSVSMSFPAGQIEALSVAGLHNADELLQALRSGQRPQIRLTPTFMGFLGSNGALPGHYSERIAGGQHSAHGEQEAAAPRAFLDLFSGRAVALFYQAWEKYRIEHAPVRATLLPRLLDLAGARRAHAEQSETIGLYSGLLQQKHVSSIVMARILADHFGVPFGIEENTGAMEAMAPHTQTALGGANALLGQRAMLGARCYRPELAVRLRIGPLSAAQYASFLPRAAASAQLQEMLKLFGQPLLRYDIVLVLRASEVWGVMLDAPQAGLGCDSFLAPASPQPDRDDLHYALQLMPALDA